MKELNFEDYITERPRLNGTLSVSIIKRGGFGFSSFFMDKVAPERPKYISLKYAYDMDFIYVGFVFSHDKMKNSLKMSYPKNNKHGMAHAIGFFNKYGINPIKFKGRYEAQEYKDRTHGEMYIIKLKK